MHPGRWGGIIQIVRAKPLEDAIMELRLSNTARHSFPTGFARVVAILACLFASGLLPLTPPRAQAIVPVESQAPGDEGGQEVELIKSGAVRAIPGQPSHHAAPSVLAFAPSRLAVAVPLDHQSRPPGRPARSHILRC
jgi:hypothetical protein